MLATEWDFMWVVFIVKVKLVKFLFFLVRATEKVSTSSGGKMELLKTSKISSLLTGICLTGLWSVSRSIASISAHTPVPTAEIWQKYIFFIILLHYTVLVYLPIWKVFVFAFACNLLDGITFLPFFVNIVPYW